VHTGSLFYVTYFVTSSQQAYHTELGSLSDLPVLVLYDSS